MNDRIPPNNEAAELGVIGGCLLEPSARDEAIAILKPEDFYDGSRKLIFGAIAEMHAKLITAIDPLTVAEWLEKSNSLEQAGGPSEIMRCIESVPHAAHTAYYAKLVCECSQRRKGIWAGTGLVRSSYDQSREIIEVLTEAEQAIHCAMETSEFDEPTAMSEVVANVLTAMKSPKPLVRHIGTEWAEMDEITPGVPFGGLVLIAARPGMGKSALVASFALRVAEANVPVLFCSYEMNRLELSERFLSNITGIEFSRIHKNRLDDGERERLLMASGQVKKWPLWIDDHCRNQTALLTTIRRLVRKRKIKLVVVDYLQLIEPADKRVNREQQVASLTRSLKLLAMNLNIGIVCLAQMNREVEKRPNREPQLSDLRESGSLEQDADQVWFLWRPGLDFTDKADDHAIVKIAKHRNGKTGKAELRWHAATMKFSGNPVDPFNGRF